MSALINDGGIPYGSLVLAIGSGTPVNYIADNLNWNDPGELLERRNELGEPSGQVLKQGFVGGSAELQLATTSTAVPALGATFTANLRGTSETWFISNRSKVYSSGDLQKVNVDFRLKINA